MFMLIVTILSLGLLLACAFWANNEKTNRLHLQTAIAEKEKAIATLALQLSACQRVNEELKEKNQFSTTRAKEFEKKIKAIFDREEESKQKRADEAIQQENQIRKLADLTEHYKIQAEVLTLQLKERSEETSALRVQLTQELAQEKKSLRAKESQWAQELKEARHMAKKAIELEKKLNSVIEQNPFAHPQVKRKIKNLETIATVMLGKKQMVEEQNENWRQALRLLSHWVLKEKNHADVPLSLGALVGQALELTQAGSLVLDGEDEQSRLLLAKSSQGALQFMQ